MTELPGAPRGSWKEAPSRHEEPPVWPKASSPAMTLRVLVNATTLVVGGGIQVGTSFIQYASRREHTQFDFVFAVSTPLYDSLPADLQSDERVRQFAVSPARILRGHRSRSLLKALEKQFRPDIIYTLGLPSYTRFRRPEVGRYTNPWEINLRNEAWSVLPFGERIAVLLRTQYRLMWARRADFFETQTEAAKAGIARRLGVPEERIKVIPNSPNSLFLSGDSRHGEQRPLSARVTIFCLAAAFRHKNLVFIPRVAHHLRSGYPQQQFRFIITIPADSRVSAEICEESRRLGVADMIENVGPLRLNECVHWYQTADIVFLPTLLEVFSATYVEAMAMSKPIITSDLDFARSVCGDAALYYDPRSAIAAAEAILRVANDSDLREGLIARGNAQLAKFPPPDRKHHQILEWLSDIVTTLRGAHQRK
jgi:glycosyltransferase involved in cell wall biosynthesis